MDALEDLSRRSGSGTVGAAASRRSRFVGNGRGVMLGVLALVAILTVARLVTVVWLLDAGWAWSLRQPLPPVVDRWMFPGPRAPVPLDRATWLTFADYADDGPWWEEIRPSVVGLQISAVGRVTDCWTERTSGNVELNDRACELIVKRGRFVPAYDASGRAAATEIRQRIDWVQRPYRIEPHDWSFTIDVPAQGNALRCAERFDGEPATVSAQRCAREADRVASIRSETGVSGNFRITYRQHTAVRFGAPAPALPTAAKTVRILYEEGMRMRVDEAGVARACRNDYPVGEPGMSRGKNPCNLHRRVVSSVRGGDQQWVTQNRTSLEMMSPQ